MRRGLEDYIIISPSWVAIRDFKQKGFNCKTIQYFTNLNKIPEEKHIYIDEMGMVDFEGWKLLYELNLRGREISCFGDFKQLLPPIDKRRFNQDNFINTIFTKSTCPITTTKRS
mgnify:CR=1 FL=1